MLPNAATTQGAPTTPTDTPAVARRAVPARRPVGDGGAVTAELAVALPAVVLVLAVLLVVGAGVMTTLRCGDGARAGARVAALGQPDADVAEVAARVAGDGAVVTVTRAPPWVTVTVRAGVAGSWFTAGPLVATGTATAWVEP
ncbi:MAG: hypothetical protein HGA44_03055 [Cellulomonadaceae bacterium]|nr:hypothetical protein [Cellulomonadaceae bacterium]